MCKHQGRTQSSDQTDNINIKLQPLPDKRRYHYNSLDKGI